MERASASGILPPGSSPGQKLPPAFAVAVTPPDLSPWRAGNAGIPGVVTHASAEPGPHALLISLMHGNELAGAVALDRLLRAGLRPRRGRLSFAFANLAAFDRFDPADPTASRFVDEDLNRLWDPAMLDGPEYSCELERARQLRPLIDTADYVLDLHSMLWASEPLLLSGSTARGRRLALAIGTPELIVADAGHLSGRRLIDYGAFTDPAGSRTAVLVEAGQHWEVETVSRTLATIAGFLRCLGLAEEVPGAPPLQPAARPRVAEVTEVITAATGAFAFVRSFRGGEVVAERQTLIARDGEAEIRTPHDDCLLIMPSLRPGRGHTAVRLARLVSPPAADDAAERKG